jgi:hypothetical protein
MNQSVEVPASSRHNIVECAKKVHHAYTSETCNLIRNIIPFCASDDTSTLGFAGEMHTLIILPNGRIGVANFMGPGTQVIKRIKRHDVGRTPVDTLARAHDIRYTLATSVDDLRIADHIFENDLKTTIDHPINIRLGYAISAKMITEDAGLISKSHFRWDFDVVPSASDKRLLELELIKMDREKDGRCPNNNVCGYPSNRVIKTLGWLLYSISKMSVGTP